MRHVVMFSGGIGSWATAQRVVEQYGPTDVTLLFADVKGDDGNPHTGESPDTYTFIDEAAAQLECELVTVADGRNIWQVFRDDRFLGNSRLANCSKYLKQRPCREWLDAHRSPDDTIVYVGIDWSETHRIPAIKANYLPYRAEAPLTEPPYIDKQGMLDAAKAAHLTVPIAYRQGSPHNNCQSACVRAGQAQWESLLRTNRDAYLYHEGQEQELRDHLGKDVAILKDRRGGNSVPLTLRSFRERQDTDQGVLFDEFDFGGCGCFVADEVDA